MKIELATITPNPIEVIYKAYRLCYSKGTQQDIKIPTREYNKIFELPDDNKMIDFIKKLLPFGHYSPLEHVNLTFYISGVSRALTHQLVRHRTGSYSQQSQRYVKLDQFEYVIPPAIEKDDALKKFYTNNMLRQQAVYNDLALNLIRNQILDNIPNIPDELELKNNICNLDSWFERTNKKQYKQFEKKAIEDARYVFPNACTSNITVTMNLNNFRKFYGLRSCKDAQWEIRELAEKMMELVKKEIPFADYEAKNCGRLCNKCTSKTTNK